MLQRKTITISSVSAVGVLAIAATVAAASQGTGHGSGGPTVTSDTVRTTTTTVAGTTESILTDAHGQPLYYYKGDTATASRVSAGVAALWPPVTTAAAPTAQGLAGRLSVVRDSHGSQLAYNGHLLYTFVSDRTGVVTGQGVQNFFVATPSLTTIGGSSSSSTGGGMNTYGGY